MRSFKDKFIDFFRNKKNIKIVVVAAIVIVTGIAIVLGVRVTKADKTRKSSTNTEISALANTTQANDLNQFNPNVTEGDLAASLNSTKAGNETSVNPDSGGTITGSEASKEYMSNAADTGYNSDGSDSYNWNTPEGVPVSVVCTIAIDCSSISGNGALTAAGFPKLEEFAADPAILGARTITVSDTNGDGRVGVDEALKQACDYNGIQYEFKGSSYVKGINYLYEFNAGQNSGWMYKVNGRIPNKGCNSYYLNGGEDVLWYYVISY